MIRVFFELYAILKGTSEHRYEATKFPTTPDLFDFCSYTSVRIHARDNSECKYFYDVFSFIDDIDLHYFNKSIHLFTKVKHIDIRLNDYILVKGNSRIKEVHVGRFIAMLNNLKKGFFLNSR